MPTITLSPQQKFNLISDLCRRAIPKFEVRYKDSTWFHRFLGRILPSYQRTTTTLFPYIYFSDRQFAASDEGWRTLAHEYVHLLDAQKHPFWFYTRYFFPQCLALLAFFAFLTPWALLSLFFALPWPSPTRSRIEQRGYAMDLAIDFWTKGSANKDLKEWILRNFTGWNYYRMEPDVERVWRWIDQTVSDIAFDKILHGEDGRPYRDINPMCGSSV